MNTPRLHYIDLFKALGVYLVVLGFHIMLVQMFKLGYKHLLHITAAPPYMDTLGGVLIAAAIVGILYLPARYILRSGHGWLRLLAGR